MKKLLAAIAIVIAGISIAFASPYFYNTEINESLPETMIDNEMTSMQQMDEPVMEKPTMIMSYSGDFVGVGDGIHDAQGIAKIVFLDDGTEYLRLENFRSTNGPDLYVYLSTDKQATDIVNLGRLKANIGNQNYEIPEGTDLEKYHNVLIWCKAFSVLFGSAELTTV